MLVEFPRCRFLGSNVRFKTIIYAQYGYPGGPGPSGSDRTEPKQDKQIWKSRTGPEQDRKKFSNLGPARTFFKNLGPDQEREQIPNLGPDQYQEIFENLGPILTDLGCYNESIKLFFGGKSEQTNCDLFDIFKLIFNRFELILL